MATTIKKVTLKSPGKNKDIDPSKGTVTNPFTSFRSASSWLNPSSLWRKKVFLLLAITVLFGLCVICFDNCIDENTNQPYATSSTVGEGSSEVTDYIDVREKIMSPTDSLRFVIISNPTRQYMEESMWTMWLIENMIRTGNYTTLYLDIDALSAALLDDYIKGLNGISLETVHLCALENELHMSMSEFCSFLADLKEYNMETDHQVTIRGMNYTFDELSMGIYPRVYKGEKQLYDYLEAYLSCPTDELEHKISDYLTSNESKLRQVLGDKQYAIYRHISDIFLEHRNGRGLKDWETYKFEDFLCSLDADASDAKAILFLGPYQMRKEKDITSFRTLMEQKFSPYQYFVYSLLDEPDIKYRRVEKHKSNGLAISELAEYDRKNEGMKE